MILVITILVLNHVFGWSKYLMAQENIDMLKNMVKENFLLASLIYIGSTVIASVLLAVPGVTFAIIAGLLFGPWIGTLLCSIAATLGAVFSFIVGRFFLKDSIKPMAVKNKYLKKWLFSENGYDDMFVLMITRLIPVFPYNLQNFAYGTTDMKLSKYTIYFHSSRDCHVYGRSCRLCRRKKQDHLYSRCNTYSRCCKYNRLSFKEKVYKDRREY